MSEESKGLLANFAQTWSKSELDSFFIVWKKDQNKIWCINGFSPFKEEISELIREENR